MRSSKNILKLITLALFVWLFSYGWLTSRVEANRAGSPPAHTGAPDETTCASSGCHTSFAVNSGSGKLTLDGLPEGGYTLYQEYDFTVTLTQGQSQRYGFQLTAVDDAGDPAGTLSVPSGSQIQVQGPTTTNARQYLTQNKNGDGFYTWTVHWKAPGNGLGTVTFYLAGLIGNNNGKVDGDYVYTLKKTLVKAPIAPPAVVPLSAASFVSGSLASETIVAMFGSSLASATLSAEGSTLPLQLSGVKVQVTDAAKRTLDAPLFFVSWSQINFLMPAGLAAGSGMVSVVRTDKIVGQASITIEDTAPGLFTANANGQGVPAATALRIKANNTQTQESISQLNSAGTAYEPAPIDLGPEGDAVFLILYGTGFRKNGGLSNVSATIGGASAEVIFAGAQGSLAGLDQANVRIPRSLIGRGNADVVFTVNGKAANTVTINVK
ncbi:MAG: hypothetical protein HYR56_04475 [Acidobacteria bacterium]|nr:hypothetical protein [Acidobacteriota bacterium]MBI3421711.1 hypothetical protein [Acidobacteriota bacterium]